MGRNVFRLLVLFKSCWLGLSDDMVMNSSGKMKIMVIRISIV